MEKQEIIKLFDNDKCKQCTMLRDDPTSFIDVWETKNLLQVAVKMKGGHKIIVLFGERLEYIDISSSYIGLGSTIVSPISDIEEIKIDWR